MISMPRCAPPPPAYTIESNDSVYVKIPKKPLTRNSLQIGTLKGRSYVNWTSEDHSNAFISLKKTVAVWEKQGRNQYLVYGKEQLGKERLKNKTAFRWEFVPYKPIPIIGCIWQRFVVLCRIIFGGTTLSEIQKKKQLKDYKVLFEGLPSPLQEQAEKVSEVAKDNDAFCKSEVIKSQRVLEGESINVLYDYAPIDLDGEKLHFLVVPKVHKEKFSELSEVEYLEATKLSQQLITQLSRSKERDIQDIHLYHKTGKDAGQIVPHWHMHMIFTSKKVQSFWEKLIVFKKMLVGPSKIKDKDLEDKVNSLRTELSPV